MTLKYLPSIISNQYNFKATTCCLYLCWRIAMPAAAGTGQNAGGERLLCFQHFLFVAVKRVFRKNISAVCVNCAVSLLKERYKGLACFFGSVGKDTYTIGCDKANCQTVDFFMAISCVEIISIVAKTTCFQTSMRMTVWAGSAK